MLHHEEYNPTDFEHQNTLVELIDSTTKNQKQNQNKGITQNVVRKRPPVVVNNFPENQNVFSNKRIVPGNNSYNDAAKKNMDKSIEANKAGKMNNQNIKIFTDSIPKGIKMKELNRHVHSGNAKMYCFPGATSTQLLHYLDINLDNTTDTVILHIGINDLLQGMTDNIINNLMNNIEQMVEKCRSFGIKRVFLSGITVTMRITCPNLEKVHNQLVSLCQKLEIAYIDNRNIIGAHLYNDGLHLLDTGKQILAKNFIFNLNNFLFQTQQPPVLR